MKDTLVRTASLKGRLNEGIYAWVSLLDAIELLMLFTFHFSQIYVFLG